MSARTKTGRCDSCEVVYINGVRCHEQGCPEAWKEKKVACFVCGFDFQPEERYQNVCPDCREEVQ